MKEYFFKKEYKYLYLSKFCYALANSIIEIFGVVMLYRSEIPIFAILLIYGLRFGIMGLATPLYIKVSSKYGVSTCTLISNILRLISIYIILFGNYDNILVFIIFILLFALPGALSNPIENDISSKYVETKNRGKFNSGKRISQILGETIATLIVTYGVITDNNIILFLIIIAFFLLEYVFISMIDYKPKLNNKNIFKTTMKYVFKQKSDLKIIFSLRTFQIIERLFIPLYIYLALQDFVLFSTIIAISLLIQTITIFITGRWTDRNICKTNNIITTIKVIVTGIFLFIKNKVIISINKMTYDNLQKVYEITLMSSTENIMKKSKEDSSLLSSINQMSLCFTEIIVLIIFAIIAFYLKEKVYIFIFLTSIIATVLMNKKINHNLKNN